MACEAGISRTFPDTAHDFAWRRAGIREQTRPRALAPISTVRFPDDHGLNSD